MQQTKYQIKEVAEMMEVESHVLRYWEEELNLVIKRNEQGHRYYTDEDIATFQFIKDLKKQGYQLRAIKKIIAEKVNRQESTYTVSDKKSTISKASASMQKNPMSIELKTSDINILDSGINEDGHQEFSIIARAGREEKALRLQNLLKQIITEAVMKHDEKLCEDVKETMVKELDYQFRIQEEEHFKHLDELLRSKQKKRRRDRNIE